MAALCDFLFIVALPIATVYACCRFDRMLEERRKLNKFNQEWREKDEEAHREAIERTAEINRLYYEHGRPRGKEM